MLWGCLVVAEVVISELAAGLLVEVREQLLEVVVLVDG
jgi:hypothetical protein